MDWISYYQLFLFDLDGLLVNTEELHFRAYVRMCQDRGFHLPWDFTAYFNIAQQDAEAPKRAIYAQFPDLEKQEPRWDVLYAEKKNAYMHLLQEEPIPLLPGVEKLLRKLQDKNIARCVVTHSSRSLVEIIKEKNPVLNTIPHWIAREDYDKPKPSPDGYLRAMNLFAHKEDRVVGFEDSIRGMKALMATSATPVLINSVDAATREEFAQQGVAVFTSFEELL